MNIKEYNLAKDSNNSPKMQMPNLIQLLLQLGPKLKHHITLNQLQELLTINHVMLRSRVKEQFHHCKFELHNTPPQRYFPNNNNTLLNLNISPRYHMIVKVNQHKSLYKTNHLKVLIQ